MRALRRLIVPVAVAVTTVLMATPAYAIRFGEPDNGRHPYVGIAVFDALVDGEPTPSWRCSGTLLSPTVFLTAGHCTDGAVAARVWLDESVQDNEEYPFGGATSYEGTPYTYPDFCIGCGSGLPGFAYRDVGIIVLSEPVTPLVWLGTAAVVLGIYLVNRPAREPAEEPAPAPAPAPAPPDR